MKTNDSLRFLAASAAAFLVEGSLNAQGGPPAYMPPAFYGTPGPVMPPPPAGTPPTILVTGDVNNDGLTDLVHLNLMLAPDTVYVQLGTPAGVYVTAAPVTVAPGPLLVTSIALGDLNMDGMLDLVMLSPAAASFMACPGPGTGFFPPGPLVAVPTAGGVLVSMAITEVTGDGIPDIQFLIDAPGGAAGIDTIQTEVGLGAFAFAAAPATAIGVGCAAFEPVDIDSNGLQDLVTLRVMPTNAFYIHGQSAPATFVPGPMPLVALPAGPPGPTFQVADVDNDSDPDLISLRVAAATIFTCLQGAPGFFGAPIASPTPGGLTDNFKIVDVNGDCVLDATYLAGAAGVVWDQLGSGLGTFLAGPIPFPLGAASYWQVAADLNTDGTIDIATLRNAGFDGVYVMINAQADPPSVSPYGTGTPGRLGTQGMLTNGPPVNGTPGFGFTTTNAPPRSLGLLLITDSPDFVGSDPFGIGALFFIDFFAATTVYAFDMRSGPNGCARSITGIPADPTLVGLPFYAESLWIWTAADAWSSPPVGASTSRAIKITIL